MASKLAFDNCIIFIIPIIVISVIPVINFVPIIPVIVISVIPIIVVFVIPVIIVIPIVLIIPFYYVPSFLLHLICIEELLTFKFPNFRRLSVRNVHFFALPTLIFMMTAGANLAHH